MRKFAINVAATLALFLMTFSTSYADEVWNLVNSEFRSPNWYCTYQLYGSTAYMTTVMTPGNFHTGSPCPLTITKS